MIILYDNHIDKPAVLLYIVIILYDNHIDKPAVLLYRMIILYDNHIDKPAVLYISYIIVIPVENVSLDLGNHKANPNYSKNDT